MSYFVLPLFPVPYLLQNILSTDQLIQINMVLLSGFSSFQAKQDSRGKKKTISHIPLFYSLLFYERQPPVCGYVVLRWSTTAPTVRKAVGTATWLLTHKFRQNDLFPGKEVGG